ncbi:MAG: DUF2249 domain-containing protein [Hyphomicrobiales bacterium]|nr:DUF2249 domain-containing protein [Hyphomicrobiales bacterium]
MIKSQRHPGEVERDVGDDRGRTVPARPDWATQRAEARAPRLRLTPAAAESQAAAILDWAAGHAAAPLLVVDVPGQVDGLREDLLRAGFASHAEAGPDGAAILFLRPTAACAPEMADLSADIGEVPLRLVDGVAHLDVAGLAPPQPLVAILRLIDGGHWRGEIAVSLPHEPIWLFPELDERGWSWRQGAGESDRFHLVLSPPQPDEEEA